METIKPKTKREEKVLKYINNFRKEQGYKPLKNFIKAVNWGDYCGCFFAENLRCNVFRPDDRYLCFINKDHKYNYIEDISILDCIEDFDSQVDLSLDIKYIPKYISKFERDFEEGKFPHLLQKVCL